MHKGPCHGKGVDSKSRNERLPQDSTDDFGARRHACGGASERLGVGAYYYVAPSLPNAEDLRHVKIAVPLQVFSRDGRLIAEYGEIKRTPVVLRRYSAALIKAVLAAEDEHFFEHPGVDYRGVLRGILNEISPSGRNVGGSTITQQITRTLNVFSRVGFELRVCNASSRSSRSGSSRSESSASSQSRRSCELYLNTYFFGQRSYGVVDRRPHLLRQGPRPAHHVGNRDARGYSEATDRPNPIASPSGRRRAAPTCCAG